MLVLVISKLWKSKVLYHCLLEIWCLQAYLQSAIMLIQPVFQACTRQLPKCLSSLTKRHHACAGNMASTGGHVASFYANGKLTLRQSLLRSPLSLSQLPFLMCLPGQASGPDKMMSAHLWAKRMHLQQPLTRVKVPKPRHCPSHSK